MSDIRVDVAYAAGPEAERQSIVELRLPAGATVADAIRLAGIADRFPEADPDKCAVGIFGERVTRDRVLMDGERVEIYRPLVADVRETLRTWARKSSKPVDD